MKKVLLTSAAIVAFASAASAMDLGNGFTAGGEVAAAYTVDAGDTTVVLTPEVVYSSGAFTTTASVDISVYENGFTLDDQFKIGQTVDFELTYDVRDNLELMMETSYDFNAGARDEVTLTATYSF
jgi:opacity protein-like surface antigen